MNKAEYQQHLLGLRKEKHIKKDEEIQKEENSRTLAYNKQNVPQNPDFLVKLCHLDLKTGKRAFTTKYMMMSAFLKQLKEYSWIYCDVINHCLKNNLDFDKMCIGINPNVFPYLSEESQKNQEIIDFINSLTIKDRKPINFLYRVGAYPKYGKIFEPYLNNYREESEALKVKYGQEALDARMAILEAKRAKREEQRVQREAKLAARETMQREREEQRSLKGRVQQSKNFVIKDNAFTDKQSTDNSERGE